MAEVGWQSFNQTGLGSYYNTVTRRKVQHLSTYIEVGGIVDAQTTMKTINTFIQDHEKNFKPNPKHKRRTWGAFTHWVFLPHDCIMRLWGREGIRFRSKWRFSRSRIGTREHTITVDELNYEALNKTKYSNQWKCQRLSGRGPTWKEECSPTTQKIWAVCFLQTSLHWYPPRQSSTCSEGKERHGRI